MSEKKCCVPKCNVTQVVLTLKNYLSQKQALCSGDDAKQRTHKDCDGITMHRFPNPEKEADRFRSWLYALGGDVLSLDNQYIHKSRRVCHKHFELKYLTWTRRLSPNAIPTLHLLGDLLDGKLPALLRPHNSRKAGKTAGYNMVGYVLPSRKPNLYASERFLGICPVGPEISQLRTNLQSVNLTDCPLYNIRIDHFR